MGEVCTADVAADFAADFAADVADDCTDDCTDAAGRHSPGRQNVLKSARVAPISTEVPSPMSVFAHHLLVWPRWASVGMVVTLSVLLSVSLTLVSLPQGLLGSAFRSAMTIAVLVPLLVATPVSAVVLHLLHELNRSRQEANRLANTDALTGVLNRRSFGDIAAREVRRAAAGPHALSLLMLDVDDFKRINDRHGHAVGDSVIRAVANRCVEMMRPGDQVGRWGGEEFVVLLPGASGENGAAIAQRLCDGVRAMPVDAEGQTIQVTVSIGVAVVRGDGPSLHSLLSQADAAMYRAKSAGKDRVVADDSAGVAPDRSG